MDQSNGTCQRVQSVIQGGHPKEKPRLRNTQKENGEKTRKLSGLAKSKGWATGTRTVLSADARTGMRKSDKSDKKWPPR